jgi:hypothetical protein
VVGVPFPALRELQNLGAAEIGIREDGVFAELTLIRGIFSCRFGYQILEADNVSPPGLPSFTPKHYPEEIHEGDPVRR